MNAIVLRPSLIQRLFQVLCLFAVLLGLVACNTIPTQQSQAEEIKSKLTFLDLPDFDQQVGRSLSSGLPELSITFYDPVSPNKLPERLQTWMSEVDAGGGRIQVVVPPGELQPKAIPLFTLLPSLWEGIMYIRKKSLEPKFSAARKYDADIMLKKDESGHKVVDKIVFKARPTPQ